MSMIKNIIIVLLLIWAFSATFLFFACRKMMNEYIANTNPKEVSVKLTDHRIDL